MITYNQEDQTFHLCMETSSYHIDAQEGLRNLFFGQAIPPEDALHLRKERFHSSFDVDTDLEREEFGGWNGHNFAYPCLKTAEACRTLTLVQKAYAIAEEGDTQTLTITLADEQAGIEVALVYTLYLQHDLFSRCARITASKPITLSSAYSASISLPRERAYAMRYVTGKWAGEGQIQTQSVKSGVTTLQSRRGITGPHYNPAVALCEPGTTEDAGEVWFVLLAYSGNWAIHVENSIFGNVRVTAGMNDFDFSAPLQPGETLSLPEVFFGHTTGGFGAMSRRLHRFENACILPAPPSPKVLYNSWEATAFDVRVEEQKVLARRAADMGCELFVLDDGWFGQRHSDQAGLGDWTVNREKFPHGLTELIDHVKGLGMEFGLWVEPEAINPDSDLYRAHPEWIYHNEKQQPITARNQYVLNITLPQVQEYLRHALSDLLRTHDIRFLKWDMNRAITDMGAGGAQQAQGLWHKHVQALYDLWKYVRENFPHVRMETCAGGGGRVDLGILQVADQCWPSDNTDPYDRLLIQEGFTQFYPPSIMMCWVTDAGKEARRGALSLEYRFHSAMCGGLAVGADISRYTPEEMETCKQMIAQYKTWRHIVQQGALYRLNTCTGKDDGVRAVEYLSADGQECLVFAFLRGASYGDAPAPIRLKGLDAKARYALAGQGTSYSGAYLESVGISVALTQDYSSAALHFIKV